MWTKGRNYKKKGLKSGTSSVPRKPSGAISTTDHAGNSGKLLVVNKNDDTVREGVIEGAHFDDGCEENARKYTKGSASLLKRSSSTSDINVARVRETGDRMTFKEPIGELTSHSEGSLHAPKLRCRVVGAYFETLGSKFFAVYSIAVSDAGNKTWFVKRRHAEIAYLSPRFHDKILSYLKLSFWK